MAKILIVDDERAYRDSLSALLRCEAHEVRAAANAREAREIAATFVPDLLVVDWILRDEVDGLQVAEALRSMNPKMEIVVITGYLGAKLEARMKQFPSVRCLEKPLEAVAILEVAQAIGR
ncbi:MAG: hypothetical protein A2V70_01910 [Planctomycetes bacterium RBG_13_63_9]|nr:MAG: hypothetical protein A2V70_01910 [Planctomycetes bacterium RBG_13_63_9]